jgi:DNA repair protein RecO (recombination protein O)
VTESASGLILRVRPFTETSLIVQWLTPGLGRIATIAKGALRPKSGFRGKLDIFFRRSELHTLREAVVRESHPGLRLDLPRLQQAAYATALIEQATETETPIPEVYDLMMSVLQHILTAPASSFTIFAFELRLLNLLGMGPDLAALALPPGTLELIRALAGRDWGFLSRLTGSTGQTSEIDHFLHAFIIYHLGRVPKGRHAALSAV